MERIKDKHIDPYELAVLRVTEIWREYWKSSKTTQDAKVRVDSLGAVLEGVAPDVETRLTTGTHGKNVMSEIRDLTRIEAETSAAASWRHEKARKRRVRNR